MNFASDNWAGAAPDVMAAVVAANEGLAPAYGGDAVTARAVAKISEIFERDCAVFFVATGGAANGLALSALCPPWGAILAHEASHIQMDECAGPEFFTGGAKVVPVAGAAGRLTPAGVASAFAQFPERPPHGAPFRTLSLTQATESGTVYSPSDIAALAAFAHANGMAVHMDGARFANAVAALGCAPADLSWRAGVDALSLGGTKNGCLAAEAVVFFNAAHAEDFAFRRKRAGQLFSKMRFVAAQFDAWLSEGLWLGLAAQANNAAQQLSRGLSDIDGVSIYWPTEANEVFAAFPEGVAAKLRAAGATFYPWTTPGAPKELRLERLITSFRTTREEIDAFLGLVRRNI